MRKNMNIARHRHPERDRNGQPNPTRYAQGMRKSRKLALAVVLGWVHLVPVWGPIG